jgi:hypothetical protein
MALRVAVLSLSLLLAVSSSVNAATASASASTLRRAAVFVTRPASASTIGIEGAVWDARDVMADCTDPSPASGTFNDVINSTGWYALSPLLSDFFSVLLFVCMFLSHVFSRLCHVMMLHGRSYLTVTTDASFTDAEQAYGAGYLEAYLTWPRIYQAAINAGTVNASALIPPVVMQFLMTNKVWMQQQIAANKGDVYWHQVSLVWTQLQGLVDGYNAYCDEDKQLEFWSIWALSGGDDLWELIEALTGDGTKASDHDHCSAIIKVTPNNEGAVHHLTSLHITTQPHTAIHCHSLQL